VRETPESDARDHAVMRVERGKHEASAEAVQQLATKPKAIPTLLEVVKPLAQAPRRDMKTIEIGRGPIDETKLRRRAPGADDGGEREDEAGAESERELEADLPTKELATRKLRRPGDDDEPEADLPTKQLPPRAKLVRAEAQGGAPRGSMMPIVAAVLLASAGAGVFIATRARSVDPAAPPTSVPAQKIAATGASTGAPSVALTADPVPVAPATSSASSPHPSEMPSAAPPRVSAPAPTPSAPRVTPSAKASSTLFTPKF